MTYGVVICPRCDRVKTADLNFKTTKCLGCNKAMKLQETKIWASSEDIEEIAFLAGQVKAKLHNAEIEYPKPKNAPRKKRTNVKIGSKKQRQLLEIAIDLTREKGSFQYEDLKKAASKTLNTRKRADIEEFLAFLQARGVIIEPRPGIYRAIEEEL